MEAYDLDQTLADTRYVLAASRGLANIFKTADVLYTPRTPFIIITARPHSTKDQRDSTSAWVKENQPNCENIYYVQPGSETETAKEKLALIKQHNAESFTDNNPDVLKLMREQDPELKLFIMRDGKREQYA